jgi:hypothetical protein
MKKRELEYTRARNLVEDREAYISHLETALFNIRMIVNAAQLDSPAALLYIGRLYERVEAACGPRVLADEYEREKGVYREALDGARMERENPSE